MASKPVTSRVSDLRLTLRYARVCVSSICECQAGKVPAVLLMCVQQILDGDRIEVVRRKIVS